jgi:nucleotide-binding universal stress UspA family protein
MIAIRRILCPVDFSEYSRRALDHAVAIARWYESRITVLHVFSAVPVTTFGPGVFETFALPGADRDQLLAETNRFIASEGASGIAIDTVIREGGPAGEILDQATSMNADLLVIGTHGRSGFERLLLGSVTEKVLRKATCPVMTVPRRLPEAVPAGPVLYKRILCPIDFSDSSLRALDYAMSLAREADGHLAVLHVISHEFENVMADVLVTDEHTTVAEYRRQREDDIRRRLKDAVPEGVATYCTVEAMVTRGKPSREILRVAAEQNIDLIVIGVQGRAAVDLTLFGSTTQHVVRGATCPVLTLRQK